MKINGFDDIKPAYEIVDSGMIGNQIIDRIINDDLAVTNLTGNNPNVMYELAIRHASAKPIIHICENGTVLPFDIKDSRTIFYTDDMFGVQELQNKFDVFVKNIDYSKEYPDNPIYNGIRIGTIFKKMQEEGQQDVADILQNILDKVSKLSGKDNRIELSKTLESNSGKLILNFEASDLETVGKYLKKIKEGVTGIREIEMKRCLGGSFEIVINLLKGVQLKAEEIELVYQTAKEFNIEFYFKKYITPQI